MKPTQPQTTEPAQHTDNGRHLQRLAKTFLPVATGWTDETAAAISALPSIIEERDRLRAELANGIALAVAAIKALPRTPEPNACALAFWAGNGGPARAAIGRAEGSAA